jgi:hypothetical protein
METGVAGDGHEEEIEAAQEQVVGRHNAPDPLQIIPTAHASESELLLWNTP